MDSWEDDDVDVTLPGAVAPSSQRMHRAGGVCRMYVSSAPTSAPRLHAASGLVSLPQPASM